MEKRTFLMAAALRFSPFEALITLSGPKIKASLVTPGTWLRGNKQPNLPRVDPGQAGPAVITALELPSSSEEPGWGGHGRGGVVEGRKLCLFLSLDLQEKASRSPGCEKNSQGLGSPSPGVNRLADVSSREAQLLRTIPETLSGAFPSKCK